MWLEPFLQQWTHAVQAILKQVIHLLFKLFKVVRVSIVCCCFLVQWVIPPMNGDQNNCFSLIQSLCSGSSDLESRAKAVSWYCKWWAWLEHIYWVCHKWQQLVILKEIVVPTLLYNSDKMTRFSGCENARSDDGAGPELFKDASIVKLWKSTYISMLPSWAPATSFESAG